MKTWTLVAVLSLVGSAAALPLRAAEPGDRRTVAVSGEAEVKVAPDLVVLNLGVETFDKELEAAKQANDARVKAVLTAAKAGGVEAKDIQTDYLSVDPQYRRDYSQSEFLGFLIRKNVVVTLRDVARFEALLSAVLKAGANTVHGVEFKTSALRRYRDQARALAVHAASEKAKALAGELGQRVGRPLTIQEEHSGWWYPYNSWWGGRWGGASQNVVQIAEGGPSGGGEGSVALGLISVSARVAVTFELTP